jgi:hypothetical protein
MLPFCRMFSGLGLFPAVKCHVDGWMQLLDGSKSRSERRLCEIYEVIIFILSFHIISSNKSNNQIHHRTSLILRHSLYCMILILLSYTYTYTYTSSTSTCTCTVYYYLHDSKDKSLPPSYSQNWSWTVPP